MRALTHLGSFVIGVTMAAGFVLAGIVRPETIVSFLDFAGDWQPSIMLVMGAAALTTLVLYRLIFRRGSPLVGGRFMVPTRRDIDIRLVTGAALFGVGWGLTGLCPGPALASALIGSASIYVFLLAMTAGMLLHRGYERLVTLMKARRRFAAGGVRPAARQA